MMDLEHVEEWIEGDGFIATAAKCHCTSQEIVNLNRLLIKAHFWSAMGQAEVESMHEHWPCTRSVPFS